MFSLEAVIGLLSARVRLKDRTGFPFELSLVIITDTSVKCSLSNEFFFANLT